MLGFATLNPAYRAHGEAMRKKPRSIKRPSELANDLIALLDALHCALKCA